MFLDPQYKGFYIALCIWFGIQLILLLDLLSFHLLPWYISGGILLAFVIATQMIRKSS